MSLDSYPKKPCKHCKNMGHFPGQCYANPKKKIKMKRSTLNNFGKTTRQWFTTRATWIKNNPPPIEGKYWECYLRIHPWCPGRVDITTLTVDHIVSRTRDPSRRFDLTNLAPACEYCNEKKGSRSLEEVRRSVV